ncbi:hypothetical protein FB451DRAFT_1320366, partial [Mycena latifolia]
HAGYVPYSLPGTILSPPMAPPQSQNGANPNSGRGVIQVVHTDDAATKLSDRVRRRCFNCCTTDTSTWRRSNLSPGKVLCNKCGLFERIHSRPRPEQFPHKRGPLASSTLRSRSPPPGQGRVHPTNNRTTPRPSASAPAPSQSSSQPSQPYIAPLAPSSEQNGSASHPGTPAPLHINGSSAANGTGESPRLPGVDSWAPANGERRSASPREHDERREERREQRRDEARTRRPAAAWTLTSPDGLSWSFLSYSSPSYSALVLCLLSPRRSVPFLVPRYLRAVSLLSF